MTRSRRQRQARLRKIIARCPLLCGAKRHEGPCDLPACSKCGAKVRGAHVIGSYQAAPCYGGATCEATLLCGKGSHGGPGAHRCARPSGHVEAGEAEHVSASGLYVWL